MITLSTQTLVSVTAEELARQLKQCESWAAVEAVIALAPDSKSEVWEVLEQQEKARIKQLKQASERRGRGAEERTSGGESFFAPPCPLLPCSPASSGELVDLKVNDLVLWSDCPGSLQEFNPFRCRKIDADGIWLDWIYHPVARYRLIKVTPES